MGSPSRPGSATKQQLDRMEKSAREARVLQDEHGDGGRRWLLALARRERNRSQATARKHRHEEPRGLVRFEDLSMYETTNLITYLDEFAAKGERVPSICARCARIGFVVEDGEVCMHSKRDPTDREMAIAEHERFKGLRSW